MASSTIARASTSVAAFQKVEIGNAATKASRAFAAVPASSKRAQSFMVRASAEEAAVPRRQMLSLLAAAAVTAGSVQKARAEGASSISIGPAPKPFGGLRKFVLLDFGNDAYSTSSLHWVFVRCLVCASLV
jgi:hypothetical protein